MATNGNNLEPAFEALLKAHVQQHSASSEAHCAQFDPDTANAYLERLLTPNALATYEGHLASCTACRRHLFTLAQLFPTTTPALNRDSSIEPTSVRERLSRWWTSWHLGALVGLGAVTATALVLVVLVNRSSQQEPMIAVNQSPDVAQAPAAAPAPSSTPSPSVWANNQADSTAKTTVAATPAAALKEPTTVAVTPPPSAEFKAEALPPPPPPQPAVPLAAPARGQQGQSGGAANQVDDLARTQNQLRNVQLPLKGPAETQVERNERSQLATRQETKQETNAPASAAAPKPAEKIVEKEARKDAQPLVATARAAELADKKSADASEGRSTAKPKMTPRMAPMKPAPTPRPGRTVNGKNFQFQNGYWTDATYDAGANLPLIRLQTDSEAYHQTVQDLPALKPYFALAPVLVVWQGKVYRVEKK